MILELEDARYIVVNLGVLERVRSFLDVQKL